VGLDILQTGLSCGAFATAIAIFEAWRLLVLQSDRLPAGIAEIGVTLSETSRYVVNAGNERAAKSEHVGRACLSLFRSPLRERGNGPSDRK
jgi:hypothetical protein